jgi:hypothetical protein
MSSPRARDILRNQASESELQSTIIDIAHRFGWLVHHARPARTRSGGWATPIQGDKGFPDLVLAKNGRIIIAELKSAKGRLSPEQETWVRALGCCEEDPPIEVYVWRPADLDEIIEKLTATDWR